MDREFLIKNFHKNKEELPDSEQRKFYFYDGHYEQYKQIVEQISQSLRIAYTLCMKYNELPSNLPQKYFGKFSFAKRVRKVLDTIENAELELLEKQGETNTWKFQDCVDTIVNYALAVVTDKIKDFDIKQQILLSTHYDIIPED